MIRSTSKDDYHPNHVESVYDPNASKFLTAAVGRLTDVAASLLACDGRIMRFVPNTDFENARNWRAGRLPCRNEHVRFPPSTAAVFVQRNNTMLELVGFYRRAMLCVRGRPTSHGPVCLSVCVRPSVTSRCSIETAERIELVLAYELPSTRPTLC